MSKMKNMGRKNAKIYKNRVKNDEKLPKNCEIIIKTKIQAFAHKSAQMLLNHLITSTIFLSNI